MELVTIIEVIKVLIEWAVWICVYAGVSALILSIILMLLVGFGVKLPKLF